MGRVASRTSEGSWMLDEYDDEDDEEEEVLRALERRRGLAREGMKCMCMVVDVIELEIGCWLVW